MNAYYQNCRNLRSIYPIYASIFIVQPRTCRRNIDNASQALDQQGKK